MQKTVVRIKLGGVLRIPPAVILRLGLKPGSKIDIKITANRTIEVTKALSRRERRIAQLRERLRVALEQRRIAEA
ncbi:MAG: hypothetical protein KDA51_15755 [Planctomycetales bacterium]|nr:hypothetical protein [Planctomycetales bacterium]